MGVRTILLLLAFAGASVGALFTPMCGLIGYVLHYNIGPERQWWEAPIQHWGLRYSLTLAVVTAIGMALHWRDLRYGKTLLLGHEKLILLFLGLVWFSYLIGEPTTERYTTVDHPAVKFTKLVLFVLMLTHVVSTPERLKVLLWAMVAGAFILGWQAWTTPYRQFVSGRLESVGGSDFNDANTLAAYLVALLPLIGVQFLRSGWWGKAACLAAGVFATNAIVLTRSRGAVLGLAASGMAALMLSPRGHRLKIALGLVVAVLGGLYLADPGFMGRASTVTESDEERDPSATSRLEIWEGSIRMLKAKPLGVGVGNFYQSIGRYAPEQAERDAHNTYVRCYGELGVQGLAALLAVLLSAFLLLRRTMRQVKDLPQKQRDDITYVAFGVTTSLAALMACSITRTLLYIEFFWWMLAMPVVIWRVAENLRAQGSVVGIAAAPTRSRLPGRSARSSTVAPSPA